MTCQQCESSVYLISFYSTLGPCFTHHFSLVACGIARLSFSNHDISWCFAKIPSSLWKLMSMSMSVLVPWKTRASSLLSGTMAARYRKIKSKVTVDGQGASPIDRNPIAFCYVYSVLLLFVSGSGTPHTKNDFKRCQCQMMFWPHASSLQMQADARCWCATCPLYQKINTYHLNSAELVNSASRKPVPHCLMTHWLQHAVVFECQRRDICSMLFKNICTMFTDWKNYMQSKNTRLYTIVIYIHMYIHRAF